MREGVSLTIRVSRVLGETRGAIIRRCYMLKSQGIGVVLWLGRVRKTKERNKISRVRLGFGLVGFVDWFRPKQKRKIIKGPFGGNWGLSGP